MPQMKIQISSFLKVPRGRPIRKGQLYYHDDGHGRRFQRSDPGELLAESIDDFLYDDLDHSVDTDIEIMLIISHVSTSSISIMMTPAMCKMAYALTRDGDSQFTAFASTMHSFDQPIPSIRH
jgi:hypothetical protein